MKPGTPVLQSTRLLDQGRERIWHLHCSLKTEKACLYWARFFICWRATQPGGMRHPIQGAGDTTCGCPGITGSVPAASLASHSACSAASVL